MFKEIREGERMEINIETNIKYNKPIETGRLKSNFKDESVIKNPVKQLTTGQKEFREIIFRSVKKTIWGKCLFKDLCTSAECFFNNYQMFYIQKRISFINTKTLNITIDKSQNNCEYLRWKMEIEKEMEEFDENNY